MLSVFRHKVLQQALRTSVTVMSEQSWTRLYLCTAYMHIVMHSEVALHTPLHHSFFIRVAALWHHPLAALHIPLPLERDNLNQSFNPFKGSVYCLRNHEMLMAWCMNNEVRCKFRSPPIWRVLIQGFMDSESLWWLLVWGQFEFPWINYNGPDCHVSALCMLWG